MTSNVRDEMSRRDALLLLAATPAVALGCEADDSMALADAMAPAKNESCTATSSNPLGPYHRENAPFDASIAEDIPGEALRITGIVQGSQCQAISGAIVEAAHFKVHQKERMPRHRKSHQT